MSKSMKFLLLAGVVSLAVGSAAQAGGKVVGSDFHASAAPACGDQCPVLAADTNRSGQIPRLWRHATGGGEFRVAGGRGGLGGDIHARLQPQDQNGGAQRFAGGRSGIGGEVYLP